MRECFAVRRRSVGASRRGARRRRDRAGAPSSREATVPAQALFLLGQTKRKREGSRRRGRRLRTCAAAIAELPPRTIVSATFVDSSARPTRRSSISHGRLSSTQDCSTPLPSRRHTMVDARYRRGAGAARISGAASAGPCRGELLPRAGAESQGQLAERGRTTPQIRLAFSAARPVASAAGRHA